jgi:hypothetical protein
LRKLLWQKTQTQSRRRAKEVWLESHQSPQISKDCRQRRLAKEQSSKESDQQSNLLKRTTAGHHRNVVDLAIAIIKKVKISSTEFIQISNQMNSVQKDLDASTTSSV